MNRAEQGSQSALASAALIPWKEEPLHVAFLGRLGGVSKGPYKSLNFATHCGDDPQAVAANWELLRNLLPASVDVAMLRQVHSAHVHRIEAGAVIPAPNGNRALRPEGDGMVTARRGLALGILTADCVPILLYDPHQGTIGALHAGWRGTLANIGGEGVRALTGLGAQARQIKAALGPAIGKCCFEIDVELADRFAARIPHALAHLECGRTGKAHLDLRGLLRDQLLEAGLLADAILNVGPCTKCASDRYFSRRAARGGPTGLQLSFIAMPT